VQSDYHFSVVRGYSQEVSQVTGESRHILPKQMRYKTVKGSEAAIRRDGGLSTV